MATDDLKTIPGLSIEKPKTKSGRIRCLWPEIAQALDAGYTIKEICLALNRNGISIHYSRLRSLVARFRSIDIARKDPSVIVSADVHAEPQTGSPDAGSALRAQRAKKIKFDHDPLSTRIKDLI
jgi:hypothetical protein